MSKLHLLTAVIFMLLCVSITAQSRNEVVLNLEQVFRLASENSKQLKLSKSNVEIAKNATNVAKNAQLPSLTAVLSASYLGDAQIIDRDFSNSMTASMPHLANNFVLEASQIIFAGGAISNSIEKAELEEQIAEFSFDRDQMNIRFILLGYYLELYKMMNQREIYIKNIEQTNLLIEQIKAKQREGMALMNDITRHELMLQNIKLSLTELDNNCAIINKQITTTLGLPDSIQIKPDSTILNIDFNNTSQEEWAQVAEKQHPELKSAIINIHIAEKETNIAEADYLPSLAFIATDHFDGPITIEIPPVDKNLNYWYAGICLKYNVSSLFKTNNSVSFARAKEHSANNIKALTEEQIKLAVHSSYIKYKESFEQLCKLEKSLCLATENYQVINNRYLNELALITEMLDASNSKLNAELQVINAKINIVFNYYKLKYISGIL